MASVRFCAWCHDPIRNEARAIRDLPFSFCCEEHRLLYHLLKKLEVKKG
jgi:hypothetical protein